MEVRIETRWGVPIGLALSVPSAWAQDGDGDGLLDVDELANMTDLTDPDTDDDTVPDGAEVLVYGSDPLALAPICVPFGEFLVQDAVLNTAATVPADMDGDGDVDAVWVGHTDGTVGWSENPGDGVFSGVAVTTTPFEGAFYVATGDLDSDGDLDALVGAYLSDRVALVLNDGGQFLPAVMLTEPLPAGAVGAVAAFDLDGDGDDDALYADRDAGAVIAFDNVAGVLQARRVVVPADGAHKIFGDDLDGDGDVDLLVAHAGGVDWYANDGTGHFSPGQVLFRDVLSYTITSLDTFDADADGDREALVALGYSSTVDLYENLGGGQFAAGVQVTGAAGTPMATAGDVDGDGDEDVIVSAGLSPGGGLRGDQVLWFENRAGMFGGLQLLVDYNGLRHPTLPHAVDMDADGDLDVLTTFQSSDAVRWYENPSVYPDADADGVSYLAERCMSHTDPDDPDTDAGTLPDGDELMLLRDPLDPSDDLGVPVDTGAPPTGGGDDDDDDATGTPTGGGSEDPLGDDKDAVVGDEGCGCAASPGLGGAWMGWIGGLVCAVRARRRR